MNKLTPAHVDYIVNFWNENYKKNNGKEIFLYEQLNICRKAVWTRPRLEMILNILKSLPMNNPIQEETIKICENKLKGLKRKI